ncbi:MAG: PadR family transcriptional regulator [Opitutaceae bacterium]
MSDRSHLSTLSTSILCQLLDRPQTGYALKRSFEDTPMGHFSSSPGALYPALQRMEKAGWIAGRIANPKALRSRRIYRITGRGKDTLKVSFMEPITRDNIIHDMDLLLLRFAFMTPLLGRRATLSYLEKLAGHLKTYVAELNEAARQLTDRPPEGALALQHGIDGYRTSLQWAESTLLKLTRIHQKEKKP